MNQPPPRKHDLGGGFTLSEFPRAGRVVGYFVTGPAAPTCRSSHQGRCGGLCLIEPTTFEGEKRVRAVWQRSGEWPHITLSPSVMCDCGGQHAFVQGGRWTGAVSPATVLPVTDEQTAAADEAGEPTWYCDQCGARFFGPGICSNSHAPNELKSLSETAEDIGEPDVPAEPVEPAVDIDEHGPVVAATEPVPAAEPAAPVVVTPIAQAKELLQRALDLLHQL